MTEKNRSITEIPAGDNLLTVPAVAKLLDKPKMTLYRWIQKGKVEAISLGGILFITTREVERLKEEKNG